MTKRRSAVDAETQEKTASKDVEILWGGFIDIRMNDADKEEFQKWVVGLADEIWTLFSDCLAEGKKYSLSWDAENNCFISSFTALLEFSQTYRYVLTSRAGTWEKSLSLLLYKHYVMLAKNWASFKPSTGRAAEVE